MIASLGRTIHPYAPVRPSSAQPPTAARAGRSSGKRRALTAVLAAALTAAPVAISVASAADANGNAAPFTASAPLAAGHGATISVANTVLTWKTLVVMPGADFAPTNGQCYTHLRISTGYLPRNVWDCRDLSAPITFVSPDVTAADLTANSSNSVAGFGYVGLIGTGGMSRGVWTLSVPVAKFDSRTASSL
ncbi:hypothetical protein [Nakamurella sp. PAMC28650]|uniref:hypothetical protein n=1 Tax=Nakamurella sp. PAMC28650 TaxID=2762325 RepID=UPI00164ED1F6|nr:hypothetical protein [Nakamurella sp. PAMC28650]QNK79330.1 hypothetical protein H7F38_13505 [Nakamurella sp. PAMC28650]